MTDCPFCKIAKKEILTEIVYEDEETLGFLDIHPLTLGHTMIIPKKHASNLLQLPDDLIDPVFRSVKKMTAILERTFRPKGFTIGINHGRISGQAVDHLHIHIIPRFEGDGGSSIHSVVHNPPKESLKEIKSRILSNEV